MLRLRATVAVLIVLTAGLAVPASAQAGSRVICDPSGQCRVVISRGTHGGSGAGHGSGRGGKQVCHLDGGQETPCYEPDLGWWNTQDNCYYKAVAPWPSPAEVALNSGSTAYHRAADGGDYYAVSCLVSTGFGYVWLAKPPPGYGGVNVWALVQRAVRLLRMAKPDIVMSPPLGKPSIVGVYDWLWIARTPFSWGRQSVTAAVPGASVTATAVALQVVWNMGDGTAITCLTPGTPWVAGDPGNAPSDCSYAYRQRGAFRVTATTTFQVAWAGTGLAASAKGQMQIHLSSSAPVTVDELQAINTVR